MKNFLFVALAMISLEAFAQRYEIGRASQTIRVKASTTTADLNLQVPMYRIDERIVVETVSCRVPQCSSEAGDGSEGNWHGFYNVKEAEKPAALAAAIRGIGVPTAQKIVKYDLLTFKPKSWTEFSQTIRRIERQLEARGFNNKFASQVLEVYGYENRINLGYGSEKTCQYVDSYCNVATLKEFKTLSHYISRPLSVDIKNQVLQSFESDTITITAGTQPNDIRFSSTGFNDYNGTIYSNGTVLELEGTRIMSALPVNEVTSSLVRDAKNNFTWSLVVPSKYSAEDKDAQIEVTFELCREGLFGTCSVVAGGPWKSTLTNSTISMTIFTPTLVQGRKYFVRARLNKVNSKYYGQSLSSYVTTGSIRF